MSIEEIINTYGWNIDYQDPHTMYIFHIQEWARMFKLFGMNMPMKVSESGQVIGTVEVNTDLLQSF